MEIIKATDLSRDKNWRIMLYAKAGTGKTSAIKYLKGKTVVFDLDGSSTVLAEMEDVTIYKINKEKPISEMMYLLSNLEEITKDCDNLVIDNVSRFQIDWFVEMGKHSKNKISNEIQDYSKWNNYFTRIMNTFYGLEDINILVTAWEMLENVNEDGVSFTRYAPRLRDGVRDSLLGITDIVGRMVVNPKTSGRGVILEGNDTVFAKNRLDNRKATSIEKLFDIGDVSHDEN